MGKRHEYSYIGSKALAYIQEITVKFIMSYLSLLEQFLQQESQSSLEKKKILELYIRLAGGSSEETKARYAQMNCGNRPPITSLGLQSAGRGLQGCGVATGRNGWGCPVPGTFGPSQLKPTHCSTG